MDPTYCRVCGVDLGANKKNWRSISGNSCCSLLTDIAKNASSSLDIKKFEEGYLCRGCLRTLEKLHKLQMQVNQLADEMATKVSQRVHLFQSTAASAILPAHPSSASTSDSQPASRKRSRSTNDIPADLQQKRRKTLRNIESLRVSSKESSSPDVAVSDFCCLC